MKITISLDDGQLLQFDIPQEETIENLKALIEVETRIPLSSQNIFFNGKIVENPSTLVSLNIQDNDLLVVNQTTGNTLQNRFIRENMTINDIPANCTPEMLLSICDKNPDIIKHFEESFQPLGRALRSKVLKDVRMQMIAYHMQKVSQEYEEDQKLNANPFDISSQSKIEENIRLGNVQENMAHAMDHMPEAFGSVSMLFVNCFVNGVHVKAFVDSGAQATIMTSDCAERCGIMRLVDRRFAGTAVGIGTAKIVGRVHLASLKIGDAFYNCSFTILDQQGVEFLLGLDMLKRHQCCIDLRNNVLSLQAGNGSHSVPFLHDHEIGSTSSSSSTSTSADTSNSTLPKTTTNTISSSTSTSSTNTTTNASMTAVEELVSLGFTSEMVIQALASCDGNIELAAAMLFESQNQ